MKVIDRRNSLLLDKNSTVITRMFQLPAVRNKKDANHTLDFDEVRMPRLLSVMSTFRRL